MISRLTNQVNSWMSSAKDDQEKHGPTSTEDSSAVINPEDKRDTSPTKRNKRNVLANVKNQIDGIGDWLGSGISKIKKGDEQGKTQQQRPAGDGSETPALEKSIKGLSIEQQEDDDNSRFARSATGGTDSNSASSSGNPSEKNDEQSGTVSNKALAGAKSFGNFLFSAANIAGKTFSEASSKIKKNSILNEFNKKQDAFLKGKAAKCSSTAVPPWAGCANEEALKEECLSLSTDKRNFIRSIPASADFHFDYDVSYPIAIATMTEDPNLEKMRFELVPKVISEENFWRNYFYRVSLIFQANKLSYMGREGDSQLASDTRISENQQLEQNTNNKCSSVSTNEFISDTFQANSVDVVEVENVKRIALSPREIQEREWEQELEADFLDYEAMTECNKLDSIKTDIWDNDIQAMLDESDLK